MDFPAGLRAGVYPLRASPRPKHGLSLTRIIHPRVTFAGAAIGIAASLAATRLLLSTDLLFHVKPSDPVTFASVPAVLFAAALAASWLSARRATKIDPAEALRYE